MRGEYFRRSSGLYKHTDKSIGGRKMSKVLDWFFKPPVDGPAAIILLRLMAGSVFVWEGLMKFVFPNQGVGRFTKLGFRAPHFFGFSGWLARNHRWHFINPGVLDATHSAAVHDRD